MSAVRFSKQYVQPKPHEVDYWVDLATNPYGAVIKYYNGDDWEQWEGSGGQSSNFDVYTKKQINEMLAKKANVGDVDSKVDDDELAEVIKNIKIKEIGNDGVALVLFKYDNTNLAVTLPTATAANAGVLSGKDFANFVKQHQLQALYSEMYDLFADIRSKYQRKLKAGKNIKITSDNVISAEINVGPGSYDAALNELDEKINIETERAIAVEDRLEKRVDQHYIETDNLFVLKANKADVYTKSQVDDKLTGVYKIKGSKTYEKLPTSNSVGDVYNITNQFTLNGTTYPAGTNVVYTEYGWDALSGNFDVTALEEDIQTVADDLSKETLRAIEAETYNSNSIINLTNTAAELTTKLNTLTGNVYTVAQVDDIVDGYLPLSGGTIDGVIHINGSTMWPLSIIGSDSNSATFSVGFANGNAVLRSEYRDRWSDIEFGHNAFKYKSNDVLHSGNYQNYALPLTGGTLTGNLSLQYTNPRIVLKDAEGTTLGAFGLYNDILSYYKTADTKWYNIWHSGNFTPSNYLPLTGGTMSGVLTLNYAKTDSRSYISQINGRAVVNGGGWAINMYSQINNNGDVLTQIGTYGTSEKLDYMYIGSNGYNGECLRIYPTHVAFGSTQIALLTSNVASATKLQTARTIWGQSFDGTGNIDGALAMRNNNAIYFKDSSGNDINMLYAKNNNDFVLGQGTCAKKYWTLIKGYKMAFYIAESETRAIMINDSGNVTIGSSDFASTNYKLYVDGNPAINGTITKYNTDKTYRFGISHYGDEARLYNIIDDGSVYGNIRIGTSNSNCIFFDGVNYRFGVRTTTPNYTLDVNGVINTNNNIYVQTENNTARQVKVANDIASISLYVAANGAKGLYDIVNGKWIIYTNATNVFLPTGNIGIGTASPSAKLHVVGNILATGTIGQESQRDLKNIIDEKVLSLDDMNTINPTRFTWKDNRDEDIHYGGIAEDIQQVIPEVVHKSGDNLTVEYANAAFAMVTSLVKHVKDLEQRLSKLEEDYKQLLLNNKQ